MASASLFNHFFKVPQSFDGDEPEATGRPPLSKPPVIANTIVEMVMERAMGNDIIVSLCLQNKVQILSAKHAYLSRTYLMVYLIFPTCV